MLYFLKRLKHRCIWSWEGTVATWKDEHSFRSWVWANLVSALAAFLLPLTTAELALILALGILVLAAELINTGIENVVDQVSKDHHPLAKKAKDAGSAGVAVTAIAAGVAWLVILIGML